MSEPTTAEEWWNAIIDMEVDEIPEAVKCIIAQAERRGAEKMRNAAKLVCEDEDCETCFDRIAALPLPGDETP